MPPLRQKMIREWELQRKSPGTVQQYVRAIADLAGYYGRSPDKISREEVRSYCHHLVVERKLAATTCNLQFVALRFFYRDVLGQEDFQLNVRCKRPSKLPEPLSRDYSRSPVEPQMTGPIRRRRGLLGWCLRTAPFPPWRVRPDCRVRDQVRRTKRVRWLVDNRASEASWRRVRPRSGDCFGSREQRL